ncbi:hypothetical protein ACQ4M4_06080 [Leptolyngbya sp. AN02str]|uniref:hypothetical protein n=1 Tax=Leptolyngbya sp. AN02str TaxID=3423363 RepID=UPI003D3103E9
MSIQIGLYDFFAYTLPGVLLVAALIYAGASLSLFQLNFQQLNELSTPITLIGIGISYILGMLLEPIAKRWYRLIQPKGRTKEIFKEFKALHPNFVVNVRPEEAGLMRAYIKQKNLELALDIEKNGATSKMLRNFSFVFLILTLILMLNWFSHSFQILYLVALCFTTFLSFVAAYESTKFDRWFHYLTLESIAAFSLEPSEHVMIKDFLTAQQPDQAMLRTKNKIE